MEREAEARQRSRRIERRDSVLKTIGTKGTFKDVLDEKLKDISFIQDMRSWPKFQRIVLKIIDHPSFELGVNAFILANTVVLAMYHHGIDEGFRQVLDILNLVSLSVSVKFSFLVMLVVLKTETLSVSSLGVYDNLLPGNGHQVNGCWIGRLPQEQMESV